MPVPHFPSGACPAYNPVVSSGLLEMHLMISINCKNDILIILLFFIDLKILSCPEKAILRLNSTANVNCSLRGNFSQVPTMNVTKIKDSCGPDTSNYTLTIVRDNGTKILTISFGNIACWATGGDYMIKVQMGNITDQQMIEIRIAGKSNT